MKNDSNDNFLEHEKSIVIQLNSEFDWVCHVHKVKLRPISIALFDSETLWGQYNGQNRTILISRKLVREHSWQHVIGILLHEMAHQYVDEHQLSNMKRMHPVLGAGETPHGLSFKEACKRLGVPAQYAKASVNLQSANLDWKLETKNQEAQKIIEKAKKLLSLGASANEFEAHLAMERVRELYAKYNLKNIEAHDQDQFVHLVITHGKKRLESWQQRTVSILLEHFFVKALICRQFDAKTGEKVQAIELIGTRENVEMAEFVYHFLLQQVEFLLNGSLKRGSPLRRAERSSFRLGVLDGFDKKLKTSLEVKVSNVVETNIISRALEKFKNDVHLDYYVSEIYPRLHSRRSSSVQVYDEAFSAGHVAGKTITLNKPIRSSSKKSGGFYFPIV
ncbi:MAG: DUF2786 domain-containing protein [Bdellovibrionales bacterium]|nr:DUF2786 domain-containing protein [Bdellovibrionales bacterium]